MAAGDILKIGQARLRLTAAGPAVAHITAPPATPT